MTFEDDLHEALVRGVEHAPGAVGLSEGARRRARRRRRRRSTLGATAAVVLAAIAVPGGMLALDRDDGRPDVASDASDASDSAAVQPGTRVETWHQATIRVPDDWGYGSLEAWCVDGGDRSPRVERPGGVVPAIGCGPSAYGVSFEEAGEDSYAAPERMGEDWVGQRTVAGVRVRVVTPDEETAHTVLDSMRDVGDGLDPAGCPVDDDGGPVAAPAGQVPVCRYDGQGRLVQSERLTGRDAEQATTAVRAAELASAGRTCRNGPTEYVVLGVGGDRVEVQWSGNGICADRGVFVDGLRHLLTEDVLYWALSPGWSGAWDRVVPMPVRLRTAD